MPSPMSPQVSIDLAEISAYMLITIKTVVTCLITLLFDECLAFNFFAVQHFVFMI